MASVDSTFDRIDRNLDGMRVEMREMRRELREEMAEMRREFREEMRALRSDFASFQGRLTQIGFGLVGALVMSVAALIVALI